MVIPEQLPFLSTVFLRKLFFLTAAIGLSGCGGTHAAADDKKPLLTNDFESLEHWLPGDLTTTLTHAQAHSGRTALMVDSTHEYSLKYANPLGRFQLQLPTRLRVSAWVLLPNAQAAATLVTSVTNPAPPDARPLVWAGLKLHETVHDYGKWTQVSQVVTLPVGLQGTNTFSIYLWRNAYNQAIYLDDLKVTREP